MAPPTSSNPRDAGAHSSGAGASRWPDDRVDKLKALWADDSLSASVIARRLGVSRNAVLGKVHRLGLSNRRKALQRRPPRAPRPHRLPRTVGSSGSARQPGAATPRNVRHAKALEPPIADVGPGLVACLEHLPRHGCHWPIGDPAAPDFRFCGRTAARRPYCEGHRVAAYKAGGPQPLAALVRQLARV